MGIETLRVALPVLFSSRRRTMIRSIRETRVKTPRANVLFEYAYLTAMLTRSRVAFCRYANAELPSDFAGVTYVPHGFL